MDALRARGPYTGGRRDVQIFFLTAEGVMVIQSYNRDGCREARGVEIPWRKVKGFYT